jgi:hypothetical protein
MIIIFIDFIYTGDVSHILDSDLSSVELLQDVYKIADFCVLDLLKSMAESALVPHLSPATYHDSAFLSAPTCWRRVLKPYDRQSASLLRNSLRKRCLRNAMNGCSVTSRSCGS